MKNLVIGILAHVDAGKTTLSEALLYTTGKIKKAGRVDHRNTYLDTHELERDRGITIFSKQAIFETPNIKVTLLDTPGHVDFSAEAERTLSVLDYAILVISGSEGVQAHTETLWNLLERYNVPTFIFITKMDSSSFDREFLMRDLYSHISSSCVDFSTEENLPERIAMVDEELLDRYMESGVVNDEDVARLTAERKLFPCFFGSGLKMDGIDSLIRALEKYTTAKEYPDEFAARVYKIGHDTTGGRITYLKITGGKLTQRQTLKYTSAESDEPIEEKITGIRLYSGAKFDTADSCAAGQVCAVTGLSATYAGQGLGAETGTSQPYLEPVLNYRIVLPAGADPRVLMPKFKLLEEEEPLLHIVWNERFGEIHAQLMGQVQCEILVSLIKDRLGIDVAFGDGRIMYKETVSAAGEGVGHFEPLRHYSEVHLLIEPIPAGSGVVFDTVADENHFERNWQRLVMFFLENKQHLGTLTGSPLTDAKITLTSGRAHLKHTVGGDFREATYRAVRQGLMMLKQRGKCVLLEPYYAFTLEVPGECVGRAISDIIARHGTYDEHESTPGISLLKGRAPVATISDYAKDVASYTHGRGRFSCRVDGYSQCHNADEVIASFAYEPEADLDNTPDSVFCSHGAGFVVPWWQVPEYMHLEALDIHENYDPTLIPPAPEVIRQNINIDEKELEAIMEREFGPIKRRVYGKPKEQAHLPDVKAPKYKKSLYVIDGYNVLFARDELEAVAQVDLETARRDLCDILANYHGFTKRDIVVVFDAYNVKGAVERKFDYNGVNVVYTKEDELGDTYIEKFVDKIGRDYNVRVVTSDGLIQLQAFRTGVLRMSAREFWAEITAVDDEINEILKELKRNPKRPQKP
ncbi:MAG: GTP-binding protein [Ruminococcaceae bacterium]|nr:GTP-binding protein [Oscillospiraceae bacterium]